MEICHQTETPQNVIRKLLAWSRASERLSLWKTRRVEELEDLDDQNASIISPAKEITIARGSRQRWSEK